MNQVESPLPFCRIKSCISLAASDGAGRVSARSLMMLLISVANIFVGNLCFSHDASSKEFKIEDGSKVTMAEVQRLDVDGYINAVAWNRNGSSLAVLSDFGGTVSIFDTSTWHVKNIFKRYGGGYSNNSLAFLPDDTLLTSTPIGTYPRVGKLSENLPAPYKSMNANNFSLMNWNVLTGTMIRTLPTLEEAHLNRAYPTFTFATDHSGLMVAGISGTDLFIFDTRTGNLIARFRAPINNGFSKEFLRSVAFSPDKNELAVGSITGNLYFLDTKSWTIIRKISLYSLPISCGSLEFSPNGRFLAVGRYRNNDLPPGMLQHLDAIDVIDIADGYRILPPLPGTEDGLKPGQPNFINSLSWKHGSDELAVGDDKSLRIWKISEKSSFLELNVPFKGGIYSLAFSQDNFLAAANINHIIIYK